MCIFSALCITWNVVNAADVIIEGGLHFGGDTMTSISPNTNRSEKLKAGNGLEVGIGIKFDILKSFEVITTIGKKADADGADNNGEVRFDRYPLNAMILYAPDGWRFGGGLTYHSDPFYKEKTDINEYRVDFESALGVLADFRYFFSDNAYVGARYTSIEYKVQNDPAGRIYDGSSVGIILGAYL